MGVSNTNDLRKGDMVLFDGKVFEVTEAQHVKPGKGGAFVRMKIRNVKLDTVIDKTMNAGQKVETAEVEEVQMQYLYKSGKDYTMMDVATFDQINIPEQDLGSAVKFLKPEMTIKIMQFRGDILGIRLPTSVELKVTETTSGFKGNTANGGGKPATLETGAVVQVPFFVEIGETIRVDTRDGEYIERVK